MRGIFISPEDLYHSVFPESYVVALMLTEKDIIVCLYERDFSLI